jgi:hypothetical protein
MGDGIKKNEMGGTCDTYRGQKMRVQDFGGKTQANDTAWVV